METVALVGSRGWSSQAIVDTVVASLHSGAIAVSGGARGADAMAAESARRRGVPVLEILPDYRLHGRRAPLVRNSEIAGRCDKMIAFWDGESRGTLHAMNQAKRMGKPVWICTEVK